MNIVEILEKHAKGSPEKTAIIFKGQPIYFKQLRDTSFSLADSFRRMGIKKGDKVAIYLPNWTEYIYSYLAIWCCGAIAVPLDFMLTQDELVSCLTHADAKVLIAKPKANLSLDALKVRCPALNEVVICQDSKEGFISFEECIQKGNPVPPRPLTQDKDYAVIFYTSGTTGRPKGVLLNYRQLGAPPQSMEFFVNGFRKEDIALCALPFSHLGGLIYIQNCLVYGLTVVLMERFIPSEFLKNIQNYRISCFWIVPSMYYALLQLKEFETFDLSSLRWMVTFGASNSPEALRRFHKFCPKAHLLNGWGLTETNAPTVVLPMGSEKIESVGRPAPWIKVEIFSAEGGYGANILDKKLPVGEIGEIVVKSWVVTDGYYNDPGLTAQAIRNGWFHTGDLGKLDAEGDLYIVGRKKEMIKVSGEIVFEPEVEQALHKHPDISEAAVIGVPDKLRGEVPKAFVVLKGNRPQDEDSLRYFLREHLAHFKIPHYFEFVSSLPKNRSGKIDKDLLRPKE
ncbi:MAG: class I adenylate-forming enzyme family protein [Candidatus Omnitrophica bacterium]|nr:class I adenylate-forming enzyme family protein [Candidatus Omnitrophota bacterium]